MLKQDIPGVCVSVLILTCLFSFVFWFFISQFNRIDEKNTHKRENFMNQCLEEKKQYECDAMYRTAYQ